MLISSFSNEKVKHAVRLRDKKYREQSREILIEGYREIRRALISGKIRFKSILISEDCFLGENEPELIEEILKQGARLLEFPRKVFEKISYRDRPDGLIALAEEPDFSLGEKNIEGSIFLLIEGVEKPGNLGTILRTAEGAGTDAVFVSDSKLDIFNPNVIRSSTGTVFTLPVYTGSLEEILGRMQEIGAASFAVTPEASSCYYNENLTGNTLFIFGSEQYGLSPLAKKKADRRIFIPMKGEADSLNLAMSAGIILYESVRQRAMLR
ncbi:MAG TPA: RNA methyltransferase [Leptospiraceae bacterium]|nr:RNA methyltransferase [Leptospiraceae bacterium]HMY69112.1 RNA methyltransferase [Leptospiraceae bacterium]HNF17422.1 RNA methyltransferase [Leptospiraceae bacterium]HNF27340.1 RNA methyltransferase [Leptospiraceae bacterium]HNH10692.1 RNA methyltransferase [Leptospiraceae bacterium]